MKVLSFLVPVLNLLKRVSFLYRIIGIVGATVFFMSNAKDVLFLSAHKDAQPLTIEMLSELEQGDIPRYLQLEGVSLMSDLYVATEDEDGYVMDASYPVYSGTQLRSGGDQSTVAAKVLIKDKNFDEASLALGSAMYIEGMYDNESFGETKGILEANGIKVADDAILIVKGEQPPAMSSSLTAAILTGLLAILLTLSFVPVRLFGVEPTPEQPTEQPAEQEA
ncbi:MAG: hypothetical protein AAGJ82_08230 [Bacteroidota bacterium]